jgi:hypothetical protein
VESAGVGVADESMLVRLCRLMVPRCGRGGFVDESEFWLRLERRICAEFEGFDDRQLRWYWCDGLSAEEYDLLCEINQARGSEDRFDLVVEVTLAADVRQWKAAGATWVLTSIEPQPADHVEREIIEAGP